MTTEKRLFSHFATSEIIEIATSKWNCHCLTKLRYHNFKIVSSAGKSRIKMHSKPLTSILNSFSYDFKPSQGVMTSADPEIGYMPRSRWHWTVTKYSIASVFGLCFRTNIYKLFTEQTFLLYLIYIFVLVWTHAYADWLWKTFISVFDLEWYNTS